MTTTPAAGTQPNRHHVDGPHATSEPGTNHATLTLTTPQKWLLALAVTGGVAIAAIGFIGSYHAVTALAYSKGFGSFSRVFTLGVDIGIGVFLALDLLLTWLRMPYPALRQGAWLLTAATIFFNASILWPDPIGVGMHGVMPLLFVIAVEAARHAVGRIADITADKHTEGPPIARWLLNPSNTFVLYRRQRLWGIRTWDQMLELEQERRIYIGKLCKEYGRGWRRVASAEQLLVLRLAKNGVSITDALELPVKEEEKQRARRALIERQQQDAENQRRREEDDYNRQQQRLEDERLQRLEDERLEREEKALRLTQEREEAERQRAIANAEAQARLAAIEREKQNADAEAERQRKEKQLAIERRIADEKARAVAAEREARREAERKLESTKLAADLMSRVGTASAAASATHHRANGVTGPASANATAASQTASPTGATANASSPAAANDTPETASQTASPATANAASHTPASTSSANASANPAGASTDTSTATGTGTVDIRQVVAVFDLLKEQNGKVPSDQKLGDALGVSRSRAQQLRTAAIDAGHTHLAKPLRIAS